MLNSNKTEMLWLYKYTGTSPIANPRKHTHTHTHKIIEVLLTVDL